MPLRAWPIALAPSLGIACVIGMGCPTEPPRRGSECDGAYPVDKVDSCSLCCQLACSDLEGEAKGTDMKGVGCKPAGFSGNGNQLYRCDCPPPEPKPTTTGGESSSSGGSNGPVCSGCCDQTSDCAVTGRFCSEPNPALECVGQDCLKIPGCSGKVCCKKKPIDTSGVEQGQSWGDPHLRTLDGLAYDLQAVGEFVLVSDGAGFDVHVRQGPTGSGRNVSLNTALALRIAGDRVGFYAGQSPALRVAGTPTTVDGMLELPGGGVIFSDDQQTYDVRWPNGAALVVRVLPDHLDLNLYVPAQLDELRGLLGDGDGVLANDLRDRAGNTLAQPPMFRDLYGVFAASWRVSQAESLFDYAAGEDTNTFTDLLYPAAPITASSLDGAVRESAKATCSGKGIIDPTALDACILDVASTGDPAFADAAMTSVPPVAAVQGMRWYDFEGAIGPEWSSTKIATTPGTTTRAATKFLGEFGNETITLRMSELGPHTTVSVALDLYVIRSWDGNINPGPDTWDASADGSALLHTTFSNFKAGSQAFQAYPGTFPDATNPGTTGAREFGSLGYSFGGSPQDAVYHLQFTFPHSASSLVLEFSGSKLQGLSDESWGIDNVELAIQ